MQSVPFGNTGLMTPPLVFGSTALGNLFREFSYESKLATMRASLSTCRSRLLSIQRASTARVWRWK